jgi:hypothetical protein
VKLLGVERGESGRLRLTILVTEDFEETTDILAQAALRGWSMDICLEMPEESEGLPN